MITFRNLVEVKISNDEPTVKALQALIDAGCLSPPAFCNHEPDGTYVGYFNSVVTDSLSKVMDSLSKHRLLVEQKQEDDDDGDDLVGIDTEDGKVIR